MQRQHDPPTASCPEARRGCRPTAPRQPGGPTGSLRGCDPKPSSNAEVIALTCQQPARRTVEVWPGGRLAARTSSAPSRCRRDLAATGCTAAPRTKPPRDAGATTTAKPSTSASRSSGASTTSMWRAARRAGTGSPWVTGIVVPPSTADTPAARPHTGPAGGLPLHQGLTSRYRAATATGSRPHRRIGRPSTPASSPAGSQTSPPPRRTGSA